MKKNALALLVVCLLICCKKEDPKPVNEPVPITQQPTGDSSSYHALFASTKVYSKFGGVFSSNASGSSYAYYSSQLINKEVYRSSDLLEIGTVSLNGIIFKNKSIVTNFHYNDTTYQVFELPHKWKILGSTGVDSFSYVNSNPFPTFDSYATLPDSMSLSSGLKIDLKKVKDCSLIRISIFGGTGSTNFPNRLVAGTDTVVNFTPAELSGINTTSAGFLSVYFYKDNYRNINGKKINFRTGLAYTSSFFKIKP